MGNHGWTDATGIWYELGRQLQAVALTMRKHRIIGAQQLCECGRLPVRELPVFGERCDVAGEQWSRARESMRRIVAATDSQGRAVGRAVVRATGVTDEIRPDEIRR